MVAPHALSDWDEFVRLDDDDRRELIDGRLETTEVPTLLHEWIVSYLLVELTNWARMHRAGTVLGSGYKLRISDNRGVMPDLLFVKKGRGRFMEQQGMVRGAPDLAVEVISPGSQRYDRVTKLNWYASVGVPEYWVVDPEAQIVQRFVLADGRYAVDGSVAGNDLFQPATFPGLSIALAELWTLPDNE